MSDLVKADASTSANASGPLRKRIKVESNDSVKEQTGISNGVHPAAPVSNPEINSVSNPVSNPVANPVSDYIANPVSNYVANPVSNYVANPVLSHVANPVSNHVANPVSNNIAYPVSNETGMVNIPDSLKHGLLEDTYPIHMINVLPKSLSAVKSREARLEQNRKAARESRRRKKQMVEELQRSVIFFSRNNHILREHNDNLSRMLVQAQNFVQMSMQQQQQAQNQQISTGTSSNQSQSTQQQNNNASTEQSQTALETSQASNESVVIKKEEAHDSSFPSTSVPQEGCTNQPQTEETLQALQGQPQSVPQQSTIQEQQAAAALTAAVQYPQLASMLGNAQTPGAVPGQVSSGNNSNTTALQAAAANFQAAMATNPNFALGYPSAFSGGAPYADAFQSAFLQQQAAYAAAASGQTPNFANLGMPATGSTAPFQHPALTQHFSQNIQGYPLSNSSAAAAGLYPVSAQVQQQTTDRTD